jgi:AbiV family abortive infection protein
MKGKTSYANLPTEKCFQLAEQISEESSILWKIGNDLAKSNNYGYAISTMISSLEELIKAVILTMDGCGFEFRRVKGMDRFFKNHNLRHFTVYILFGYGVFGDELKKWVLVMIQEPKVFKDFLIKFFKNDPETKELVEKYVKSKLTMLKTEFDWFKEMDLVRQSGVYSDYKDDLQLPSQKTEEDFMQVEMRLSKAREACLLMMLAFREPAESAKEELEKLKISLKQENRYKWFGEQIATLGKNRFNVFDAVEQRIQKDFV